MATSTDAAPLIINFLLLSSAFSYFVVKYFISLNFCFFGRSNSEDLKPLVEHRSIVEFLDSLLGVVLLSSKLYYWLKNYKSVFGEEL